MDKSIDYILEVARCGGISKAARNLFITPSALSKYIIQKEEELGVQLFRRDGNKFSLTYPGERYVEMLRDARAVQEKIRQEMDRLADLYAGRLRVGAQMSLMEPMVQRIVPALQDQCPNIRLSITEDETGGLWRQLKTNQLDLILTISREKDDGLCYELITESPVVVAAAKGSPLERCAQPRDGFSYPWVSEEALIREQFVLDIGERSLRRFAPHLFKKDVDIRRSEITVSNARTALLCVEQDLGIIILPALQVDTMRFGDRVALFSFGPEEQKAQLHVVWDPRAPLGYEIGEFARIARSCLCPPFHQL
ncbi:MAG: LysR family transcriptional regulator [Oscillospiraceae bacterium]|nr:LysR family transcriptional regulator [Oscillospiraceae bacterium]